MSAALAMADDMADDVDPGEDYTWASGFSPRVSAARFKAAWDALAETLGHPPTAAELVDAARQPDHVLHLCFNWDVAAAAAAHWIEQAQALIRHLRVTYSRGPVRDMPMRALMQVQVEGVRTYVANGLVLGDAQFRRQVMHEALRDVRAFTSKYMVFLTAIGATAQAAALADAIVQATADTL